MTPDSKTRTWLAQTRAAWDERADMFNALSSANAKSDDRKTEIDFVLHALGLSPGNRVLDAGCGTGHFAIALAERGCRVDGIDLSPEMILRAEQNAADAGVHITFSVGDLTPLSAPNHAYEAVVSRMVLQFSPHLTAVLDEFERVIDAGGKMWLAVPGSLSPVNRHSWKRFLAEETEPMNYVTPWELIRLLEEHGWRIEEQWGSFDPIGQDAGNSASELDVTTLPISLQQAAATVWNVIAAR